MSRRQEEAQCQHQLIVKENNGKEERPEEKCSRMASKVRRGHYHSSPLRATMAEGWIKVVRVLSMPSALFRGRKPPVTSLTACSTRCST